ncbi:MAG: S41 family peptidase [Bacteroidota bacterium]
MWIVLLFVLSSPQLSAQNAPVPQERQITNLEVFARLYGYVRFFHPSDEAAQIDWNRFAVHGCREVRMANSTKDLHQKLHDLFAPIAPSLRLTSGDPSEAYPIQQLQPPKHRRAKTVYWQHEGVFLGNANNIYSSTRVNRPDFNNTAGMSGEFALGLDAKPFRGQTLRLKARTWRPIPYAGQAGLWLIALGPKGKPLTTAATRPGDLRKSGWQDQELFEVEVPATADSLAYGCVISGGAPFYVDDFVLEARTPEGWKAVHHNDFEAGQTLRPEPNQPYRAAYLPCDGGQGLRTLQLKFAPEMAPDRFENAKSRFDAAPEKGEIFSAELGDDLHVQMPLRLWSHEGQTWPIADADAAQSLQSALDALDEIAPHDAATRAAVLLITWNVAQHFFPYHDLMHEDWSTALRGALTEGLKEKTAAEFLWVLRRLTSKLEDGHVFVKYDADALESHMPAFQWRRVERKMVVWHVMEDGPDLEVGEVIVGVDGIAAEQWYHEKRRYFSAATPGWRAYRMASTGFRGPAKTRVSLEVLGKNGELRGVDVVRKLPFMEYYALRKHKSRDKEREVAPGIWYVNLDRISMPELNLLMPKLEKAKALICDLRGYPNGNDDLINHLLPVNDTSTHWMQVPRIVRPNYEVAEMLSIGWQKQKKKPHLDVPVFLLIDGTAISYAESCAAFYDHYDLATIIGTPTAGSNGNINTIQLPGKYSVSFTGMRVNRHDGGQQHGIGIVPDVEIAPTLEGVRAGRDEILEKAIELAKDAGK